LKTTGEIQVASFHFVPEKCMRQEPSGKGDGTAETPAEVCNRETPARYEQPQRRVRNDTWQENAHPHSHE